MLVWMSEYGSCVQMIWVVNKTSTMQVQSIHNLTAQANQVRYAINMIYP